MAESKLTSPTESEKTDPLDTVLSYGVPLRLARVEDAERWLQEYMPRYESLDAEQRTTVRFVALTLAKIAVNTTQQLAELRRRRLP